MLETYIKIPLTNGHDICHAAVLLVYANTPPGQRAAAMKPICDAVFEEKQG